MTVTLNGLDGSNAETRKAFLEAETYEEQQAVTDAEANHKAAELQVTLAELDHKFWREVCKMRRAELRAGKLEA
jgi:hypothetical protein